MNTTSSEQVTGRPDDAPRGRESLWTALRRRSLLTISGLLLVVGTVVGSVFLPHLPSHGMGSWLPMSRVLDPGRTQEQAAGTGTRAYHGTQPYGGRTGPGHGVEHPSAPVLPSPVGSGPYGKALPPRTSAHPRHPRTVHHPGNPFNFFKHLQCKILHRRC